MLLGSAALGALAIGDAPPINPFVIPPPALRRPTGHNIGVIPGPVFPTVFSGALAEVPPQQNEPGVTLYFSAGAGDLSTATLVFTKPSGVAYEVGAPLIYIGEPTATFAIGNFLGGTYLVYTFGQTELDELGTWQVQVRNSGGTSGIGTFTVGETPSPVIHPPRPLPPRPPGPVPPGPLPLPGQEQFVYNPISPYPLPASPVLHQKITVVDDAGTASTSPITVSGNGALINGLPTFIIHSNHASYGFVWNGTQWNIV